MSDYPLSTVSSKKFKKSSKDLLNKSACQLGLPPAPDKSMYQHILKGQTIFIEIYYQGKVLQTEYNKYVQFMGGTLYKRLNPKVTILLTNTEQQELANILQRVRRICPQCKVVSILWFEMSFQKKCKMPFDDYLLQNINKPKEKSVSKKQVKIEELNLDSYFQNVSEDTQLFYKDYFAKNKKKNFQYANNKKERLPPHYYIPAQEFQMPAIPKKKTNKGESIDKKQRKTNRATTKLPAHKQVEQTKAIKSDKAKNKKEEKVQTKNAEQHQIQKVQKPSKPIQQTQPQESEYVPKRGLNSLMQKYLVNADSDYSFQSKPKIQQVSVKSVSKSKKSIRTLSVKQKESKGMKNQTKSKQSLQKFAITPKYKDLKFMSSTQRQAQKMLAIQKLKLSLSKNMTNRLLIVSNSKRLLQKIQQHNKQYQGTNFLYIKYIDYANYWQFMLSSPKNKLEAYFPINQRRFIDRPLYFALKANFAHTPKPVSLNILKQIAAYNKKVRDRSEEKEWTPKRFVIRDQLQLVCRQEIIKDKKITFLQSQLSNQQLQLIVNKLGGKVIGLNNLIMNEKVDIVVTSRNHIKKNQCLYLTEQQLWEKMFPLHFSPS